MHRIVKYTDLVKFSKSIIKKKKSATGISIKKEKKNVKVIRKLCQIIAAIFYF